MLQLTDGLVVNSDASIRRKTKIKAKMSDFVEAILAPVKEESSRHGEYEPDPEEFAAQMDDNWQEEDLDGVQVYAYESEDLD